MLVPLLVQWIDIGEGGWEGSALAAFCTVTREHNLDEPVVVDQYVYYLPYDAPHRP